MNRSIAIVVAALALMVGLVSASHAQSLHRPLAATCPTSGIVSGGGSGTALVGVDNSFGFRLFNQIVSANAGKNVFLSPTSGAIVLDMLYAGARGSSQTQTAAALGVRGLSAQAVRDRASALLAALKSNDPRVRLEIANSVWARAGVQFHQAFLQQARRYYGAQVSALDFRSAEAPAKINGWVSCATHNTITGIVKTIASDMVMYVLNATYFHGEWTTAFDPQNTRVGPFTTASGQQVQVPFMHLNHVSLPYYAGSDFQAMNLPYGKGRYSMVIVLPRSDLSLQTFARRLTLSTWRNWTSHLQPASMPLALPRFALKNSWNLNKSLAALGMHTAIGTHGNFSGICVRCVLTEVKQKSNLSVDEKGTTAAAVTSGGVSVTAIGPTMTVDHPFLLAIRDGKTGAVLFVGAVNNPLENSPL